MSKNSSRIEENRTIIHLFLFRSRLQKSGAAVGKINVTFNSTLCKQTKFTNTVEYFCFQVKISNF